MEANAVEPSIVSAVCNWRFGGQSLKSQGVIAKPINGGAKPTVAVLADKYQWAKPWYRLGGVGHDGNKNPVHATRFVAPEMATIVCSEKQISLSTLLERKGM